MSSSSSQFCRVCNKTGTKCCQKCHQAGIDILYCSRECQLQDWKAGHKSECCKSAGESAKPKPDYSGMKLGSRRLDQLGPPKPEELLQQIERLQEPSPITVKVPVDPNEPGGQCVCIIPESLRDELFAIPGFPQPLHQHDPNGIELRRTPNKGWGVFAAKRFRAGDLVIAERPLLIRPAGYKLALEEVLKCTSREEVITRNVDFSEKDLVKAISLMTPENKALYLALHNCHTDDPEHPLIAICRTNSLQAGLGEYQGYPYVGVGNIVSRLNHSCSPNIIRAFNKETLSYNLWVRSDVAVGEELTIYYCDPFAKYADRCKSLRSYGFLCRCNACVNHETSDKRRAELLMGFSGFLIYTHQWLYTMNARHPGPLPYVMQQLKLAEVEGLETTSVYTSLVAAAFLCHVGRGDRVQAKKYYKILAQEHNFSEFDFDDLTKAFTDDFLALDGDVTKHPKWAVGKR